MLEEIAYSNLAGELVVLPKLWMQADPDFVHAHAWWQGGYGLCWKYKGQQIQLFAGIPLSAFPTPMGDGVLIIDAPGMDAPDNAAIYNADGSLRFRLKAPKPLSRHWPGYVHTPEQIEKRPPEGFWQVGWGCGDGITDFSRPWMWANIGLHCDVYERRYFDPKTGEFDLEHYSTARR
ncbi:MAG: hypothetical protein JNM42_03330 [Propionivibrio sp.]|uniref:hypothetical protein n=1 Tax=Propionivibrio sp. TaxID=2212460 RepID=UPI001A585405|nr:hypothetical protein [Propionivibrio sp.]MBL8413451.1 hypothetical protein [Propionivibrio sp.]